MKLINIETGVEYQSTLCEVKNRIGHCVYDLIATGKKYEKYEGYTSFNKPKTELCEVTQLTTSDTHRAICFLEPLEKPNPMPEILAGDFIYWDYENGQRDFGYVFKHHHLESFLLGKKLIELYRNGVSIWKQSPN